MTGEPPIPRRRLGRPKSGVQLGIESLHPIDALRALDARAKPNLKRAVPALVLALVAFGFGDHLGGIDQTQPARFAVFGRAVNLSKGRVSLLVLGLVLVFVVAGVIATRSIAGELARVSEQRGGVAASSAVRLICRIVGYITVALGLLALLRVDLGNLLVGGAVTGVVVGIAAQQTLGNFFAGMVLLFARPYVPGQRVKVRTGSMGGPFEGVIISAGLIYTTIDTEDGVISMPNAGLLAAAIGPSPEPPMTEGSQLPIGDGPQLPVSGPL
ncbi:MAG TPA: mechanosensitive ion channel family protein [Jatrophihabitans sp.]|nr:mechanosensitive ion channel family protein [Jatrophihabitans sp.]